MSARVPDSALSYDLLHSQMLFIMRILMFTKLNPALFLTKGILRSSTLSYVSLHNDNLIYMSKLSTPFSVRLAFQRDASRIRTMQINGDMDQ